MFLPTKQKFNASTAKAFQVANLVTEYVLDSKDFFFLKLETTIAKCTSFDAKNVTTVMKVYCRDKCFDLKVEFSLSIRPTLSIQDEKTCEWELFSDSIKLTTKNYPTSVKINAHIGRNTAWFTVHGQDNELIVSEFKKSFQ